MAPFTAVSRSSMRVEVESSVAVSKAAEMVTPSGVTLDVSSVEATLRVAKPIFMSRPAAMAP